MTRATSLLLILTLLAAQTVSAQSLRLRTELSGTLNRAGASSLDAALGFASRATSGANARLMWDRSVGVFRFEVQALINQTQGDNVALATALAPFLPPPAPTTLFDLTGNWTSTTNTNQTGRLDRLSISFTTDNLVLKLGRQAITWGGGFVFHPGDIVAPFAPGAIDTSYKPGVDMLYTQYLFDNGADVQVIAVPRAATVGGAVAFSASTYALRARSNLGSLDTSLMLARDRGDSVAGLSLSGALGGASWNAEAVYWALASGGSQPTYLLNISNFGTLFGRNISYYGEYFFSGFGVAASVPLDSLPADLSKRLSTGQLFLAGRDFLSLGAQMQLSDDLTLAPNALVSLNDGSALGSLSFNYALGDNSNIILNLSQPFGATGTEFGGRETTLGSGVFVAPAASATLRLVRFF